MNIGTWLNSVTITAFGSAPNAAPITVKGTSGGGDGLGMGTMISGRFETIDNNISVKGTGGGSGIDGFGLGGQGVALLGLDFFMSGNGSITIEGKGSTAAPAPAPDIAFLPFGFN